jgi:hypothetical protein
LTPVCAVVPTNHSYPLEGSSCIHLKGIRLVLQ